MDVKEIKYRKTENEISEKTKYLPVNVTDRASCPIFSEHQFSQTNSLSLLFKDKCTFSNKGGTCPDYIRVLSGLRKNALVSHDLMDKEVTIRNYEII